MAVEGMTPQRTDVVCCQRCGRSALPREPHWLNQPHREIIGLRVQRCPEHWTEWSIRNTRDGRTNDNRAAMAEALSQPVSIIHPYLEPWSQVPLPSDDDLDILSEPDDARNAHRIKNSDTRAVAMKIIREQRKRNQ